MSDLQMLSKRGQSAHKLGRFGEEHIRKLLPKSLIVRDVDLVWKHITIEVKTSNTPSGNSYTFSMRHRPIAQIIICVGLKDNKPFKYWVLPSNKVKESAQVLSLSFGGGYYYKSQKWLVKQEDIASTVLKYAQIGD